MKPRTGANLREILKARIPWLTPIGLAPNEPSESPGFHACTDGTERDAFIDNWIAIESTKWYSAIKEIDGQYLFYKMRNPAANRWANAVLSHPSNTIVRFNPIRISEQEISAHSIKEELPKLPGNTRLALGF